MARFVTPGLDQVAVAYMDTTKLRIITLDIEYLDSVGWHVRRPQRVSQLIATWRWRACK